MGKDKSFDVHIIHEGPVNQKYYLLHVLQRTFFNYYYQSYSLDGVPSSLYLHIPWDGDVGDLQALLWVFMQGISAPPPTHTHLLPPRSALPFYCIPMTKKH